MYLPPHFEETDNTQIAALIQNCPLASVVCQFKGEFIANHIPIIQNGEGQFIGHKAKANTLHEMFPNGADAAIAIFKAEDSYISHNWYPTKQKTHRAVPTWNYQVVHLHGVISFDHTDKAKCAVVGKLTKFYEQMHSANREWRMADAPQDYMEGILDNIVAFTFEAQKIMAKSKLSQNKADIDFNAVIRAMEDNAKPSLANAMKRIGKRG